MTVFPGGVVPTGTAARLLGISRRRMNEIIRLGRVPLIEGMPGGSKRDRFVPVDALIGLATALEPGTTPRWGRSPRWSFHCGQPTRNHWYRWVLSEHYLGNPLDLHEFLFTINSCTQVPNPHQLALFTDNGPF